MPINKKRVIALENIIQVEPEIPIKVRYAHDGIFEDGETVPTVTRKKNGLVTAIIVNFLYQRYNYDNNP